MRLIVIAAIAAALVVPAAAQDKMKLRIGTEGAYPPFNSTTANGELVGFDVDIAKALCEKMDAECTFVAQDWDGIIPALLANKYDAIIASMSITPERAEVVAFSNKYYNTPPAIAVPKDSSLTEATPEALSDIIMGAQSSTTHANYAAAKFPDTQLRRYGSPDEYKLDLESGRIDAAIDDVVVLSDWIDSPDGECCKILTTLKVDPEINGVGAGVAVRQDEEELVAKLNEAIAAIRADGTYKQINDKYFAFDVYGD